MDQSGSCAKINWTPEGEIRLRTNFAFPQIHFLEFTLEGVFFTII